MMADAYELECAAHFATRARLVEEMAGSLERDRAAWAERMQKKHGIPEGFAWQIDARTGAILVASPDGAPPPAPEPDPDRMPDALAEE